jgi:alkanesulfonate monooxygenase SsuD/methylene tetrahydromethanopterin reductase-like flavin-dependent oxidoreductase (luciferase family)
MTSSRPLRFGLWYAFRNPAAWRRPFPELYAEVFEQIRWAEGIGFDDVWLTEHHFCEDGHAPSILPLAAAIAALTSRIRIGTGVLLLPLHNPVRVAEDGATIDIISNGRFELGIGVGYRPQEFPPLGAERSERATRTDEGLEIIRRLWSGETLSFSGRCRCRLRRQSGSEDLLRPRLAAPRAGGTGTWAQRTTAPSRRCTGKSSETPEKTPNPGASPAGIFG